MRYVLAAFGTAALIIFTVPAVHASPFDAAVQSLTDGQTAYAKKGGWHGGGKGWKHGWKGVVDGVTTGAGGEVRHHGHELGGIGESTAGGRRPSCTRNQASDRGVDCGLNLAGVTTNRPRQPLHAGGAFLCYCTTFPAMADLALTTRVVSMDRDFAEAIIHFALRRDPAWVAAALADVTCQLKAEGYSSGEIVAAIDELLDELEGSGQTRH
jgi:hypothetical protein